MLFDKGKLTLTLLVLYKIFEFYLTGFFGFTYALLVKDYLFNNLFI